MSSKKIDLLKKKITLLERGDVKQLCEDCITYSVEYGIGFRTDQFLIILKDTLIFLEQQERDICPQKDLEDEIAEIKSESLNKNK